MLRPQNMTQVEDWGELVPEGWYHVRVSKVQDADAEGNDLLSKAEEPVVKIVMKVQDEGDSFGRAVTDVPSLQDHALAKLKAYYKAVNYFPGSEGHDPQNLLDREFYVKVTHEMYEGEKRGKIAPWNIKPLSDGRPRK